MNLSDVYNNPDYSDLTIVLKDGREVKVHKDILCTANEWFKAACGINSQFAEASKPVLKLKHDHPDAVEHVLHHIYKIPPLKFNVQSWRHWLKVHLVADKYLKPALSAIARSQFTHIAFTQRDSDVIFDIIETISDEMKYDERFLQLAQSLREHNIVALLLNDRVCKKVDEDKDWRWEVINTLVDQKKRSGEYSVFLCLNHIRQLFLSGREMHMGRCSMCHGNESRTAVKATIVYFEK